MVGFFTRSRLNRAEQRVSKSKGSDTLWVSFAYDPQGNLVEPAISEAERARYAKVRFYDPLLDDKGKGHKPSPGELVFRKQLAEARKRAEALNAVRIAKMPKSEPVIPKKDLVEEEEPPVISEKERQKNIISLRRWTEAHNREHGDGHHGSFGNWNF